MLILFSLVYVVTCWTLNIRMFRNKFFPNRCLLDSVFPLDWGLRLRGDDTSLLTSLDLGFELSESARLMLC